MLPWNLACNAAKHLSGWGPNVNDPVLRYQCTTLIVKMYQSLVRGTQRRRSGKVSESMIEAFQSITQFVLTHRRRNVTLKFRIGRRNQIDKLD